MAQLACSTILAMYVSASGALPFCAQVHQDCSWHGCWVMLLPQQQLIIMHAGD